MKITTGFAWPMYCLLLFLSSVVIQVFSVETLQPDNFPSPLHFQGGFRPSAPFQPATISQDANIRASATSSATSGRSPRVFQSDEESETTQQKQDTTKHSPLKTFDGFPEDFKKGLRPFRFGDSNKQHQSEATEKFTSQFPIFSSLSGFQESLFPPSSPPGTVTQQTFGNGDRNEAPIRSSRAKKPAPHEDSAHQDAQSDSSEDFVNFPQNSKESQRPQNDPRDSSQHQPLRNINGQPNSFESTSSASPQKPSARPSHQDDFQHQQQFVSNFQNSGRFRPGQFPRGFQSQRGPDNSNQPQTFIPIAHFQPPGPFQFGTFQPFAPESQGGTRFGPPRPFRQIINQPLFFAPPGLHFEGNRGQFQGGAGHFPRRPQQQPQQRPQSHFQLQQHQQQQEEEQPEHDQQQQFHEDNTNKQHSSATDNILGSGNFGIIRGGIFADDDNPRPSFQPFQHDYRPQNNDDQEDFFNGFHDFQPFPGPLNNALTSITARGAESTSSAAKAVKPKSGTKARPRKV